MPPRAAAAAATVPQVRTHVVKDFVLNMVKEAQERKWAEMKVRQGGRGRTTGLVLVIGPSW